MEGDQVYLVKHDYTEKDSLSKQVADFIENMRFRDAVNVIFRGQASWKWGLVPSLFRDNWREQLMASLPSSLYPIDVKLSLSDIKPRFRRIKPELELRLASEHSAVLAFANEADEAGIALPDYTYDMSQKLLMGYDYVVQACSSDSAPARWGEPGVTEFDPLIALAQHYGYPTSFLDWSWSPYIALHMAAMGVVRHRPDYLAEKFTLWALGTTVKGFDGVSSFGWRLVQLPRQANERLRAQRGVFLTSSYNNLAQISNEFGLDAYMADHKTEWGTPWSAIMLGRIDIPSTCALDILYQLNRIGVNSRTMFPGFDGVQRYLYDLALYSPEWERIKSHHEENDRDV